MQGAARQADRADGPFERTLLAEQLVARPAGTAVRVPARRRRPRTARPAGTTATSTPVSGIPPARRPRASGGPTTAPRVWAATRFDALVPHDLRHTAISLMAASGMRPEMIAVRVGHSDGGKLILQRYRHLFPDELGVHLGRYDEFMRERRERLQGVG